MMNYHQSGPPLMDSRLLLEAHASAAAACRAACRPARRARSTNGHKAVEEDHLAGQDRAQDEAWGGEQPAGGQLAAKGKDALELAVPALNRLRAQCMVQ